MNYDAALKSVLQRQLRGGVLADWVGLRVTRWLNVEIPMVRTLRLDMLGETLEGGLAHCELQSRNEKFMRVRMAEYALAAFRLYGRIPRQLVIYVGQPRLRMKDRLEGPDWWYRCDMVDARDLDAAKLLDSPKLEDNIFAILAGMRDERKTVRQILERIAASEDAAQREASLAELTTLAGLRRLGSIIRQETKQVPILDDIMDHDLFGPILREGIAEGIEQGIEQGIEKGSHDTALQMLRLMISQRFGKVPVGVARRLKELSVSEIQTLARRVNKVSSPEDLFKK